MQRQGTGHGPMGVKIGKGRKWKENIKNNCGEGRVNGKWAGKVNWGG